MVKRPNQHVGNPHLSRDEHCGGVHFAFGLDTGGWSSSRGVYQSHGIVHSNLPVTTFSRETLTRGIEGNDAEKSVTQIR